MIRIIRALAERSTADENHRLLVQLDTARKDLAALRRANAVLVSDKAAIQGVVDELRARVGVRWQAGL